MKEIHDLEYWKEYRRIYYRTHKEQYKKYKNRHKDKYNKPSYDNKGRPRKYFTEEERNISLKSKFLEMYGGMCECCKETIYEFLCLDHKLGRERKYKNEHGDAAYRRAIKEYDPKEYRILCANCNTATRLGKICPHKKLADII